MTLPNILTYGRILLIPVMMLVYYLPFHWNHYVSAGIFILAALTDWLDGYFARVLKQGSAFGAFLDPVADKLIVAIALVMIVGSLDLPYLALPVAVIIGREIAVSALREWMSTIGKRASVAVSRVGKIKTALQMVAVIILLAYTPGIHVWMAWVGYVLLFVSAILTLWSMTQYLKVAWPDLTFHQNRP